MKKSIWKLAYPITLTHGVFMKRSKKRGTKPRTNEMTVPNPQKRGAVTRNRKTVTMFVEGFMSGYLLGIFDAGDGVARSMEALERRARFIAQAR